MEEPLRKYHGVHATPKTENMRRQINVHSDARGFLVTQVSVTHVVVRLGFEGCMAAQRLPDPHA